MTPTLTMQWMDSDRTATSRTGTPAARSDDALEAFLRGIERRALRVAELAAGSREDALDIVQDSMLAFVRNYRDKPVSDWAPLFHTVLHSRIMDWKRREARRGKWLVWLRPAEDDPEDNPLLNVPETVDSNPARLLELASDIGCVQAVPDRVARIAAFSSVVMALAPSDRVASTILDKAAAHLSEAVQAAVRRVHLSGPDAPRVAALGSVFRNEQVVRRFTDFLTLPWPTFALIEPRGDVLDGAAALVTLDPKHPLHGHLSAAER